MTDSVRKSFAVLAGLLGTAAPAQAQLSYRPALSAVASSVGLGVEASLDGSRFGVRAGYYLFSRDFDREVEGILYTVEPHLRQGRVAADFHPFQGPLRISGGILLSGARADGIAVLTAPITIGTRTYQPSEIGSLEGRLAYDRDLMPFASLGFASGGTVGFVCDLGIVFSGRPTFQLLADTPLTGAERAEFEQQVALEEAEIRQAIQDEPLARFYPLVLLGVRVRF